MGVEYKAHYYSKGAIHFFTSVKLLYFLWCSRYCFLAVLLTILDPEPRAETSLAVKEAYLDECSLQVYSIQHFLAAQSFIQIYFTWNANAWPTLSSVIGDLRRCEGLFFCRSGFYLFCSHSCTRARNFSIITSWITKSLLLLLHTWCTPWRHFS